MNNQINQGFLKIWKESFKLCLVLGKRNDLDKNILRVLERNKNGLMLAMIMSMCFINWLKKLNEVHLQGKSVLT